jgi:hypothetical protein
MIGPIYTEVQQTIWWSAPEPKHETRREQAAWNRVRRKAQKRFQSLRRRYGSEHDQLWLEMAVERSKRLIKP